MLFLQSKQQMVRTSLKKSGKYLQTSVSSWRGIQILLHTIGTM